MSLSVAEIRRIEAVEQDVHYLKTLVEHQYDKQSWEKPPVSELLTEDQRRAQLAGPQAAIPPGAVEAMVAGLSDADKEQMMQLFTRLLQPRAPAPLADTVPQSPPASKNTPSPVFDPASDESSVVVDNPNTPEARS